MTQRFGLPKWVFTSNPDLPNGESRIQVDVGQTGFFQGREFRTLYEFSVASGATSIIKFVTTNNFILQQFVAELWTAELRVELLSGGTEGGTFSTSLPIMRSNEPVTDYTSVTAITAGGTHTGGTVKDLLQLYAVSNPAKGSATEGGSDASLGFVAGTYYIKLQNINSVTATGLLKIRWEERPSGV